MKYDSQLSEVIKLLPNSKNILISLPSDVTVDQLASGLALFLSLEQSGKTVSIVTEGVIKVGHTNLFGVGDVKDKLPEVKGGNLTITLGGIVAPDKTVPALKKLDWSPTGSEMKDLKLVFHVVPGQKFEPTFITPSYEGEGFDLIFTIGLENLNSLGSIYSNNALVFSNSYIINIDNKSGNSQYGTSNVIDTSVSSLSEMVAQVLPILGLPFEGDIATNILSGIFSATSNLQGNNVGADTYTTVAQALQTGGKKPLMDVKPVQTEQAQSPKSVGFDLNQILNVPVAPVTPEASPDNFPVPTIVSSGIEQKIDTPLPSPEETPMGEGVETVNPEADWLTPKIFNTGKTGLG